MSKNLRNTPPHWCRDALPSAKGWCHPQTGELLISVPGGVGDFAAAKKEQPKVEAQKVVIEIEVPEVVQEEIKEPESTVEEVKVEEPIKETPKEEPKAEEKVEEPKKEEEEPKKTKRTYKRRKKEAE